MKNPVFGKTMENVRKYTDIKLVTTNRRGNYLVSEPNCHKTKSFSENLLAIEMRKIKVKINKQVYLGLSTLEISKTLMYVLWYDYIKLKYQQNENLRYTDRDSFIIHIKTKDVYKNIGNDVEKRFYISNYETNRPFPTRKIRK